jgi:hypothetical protein
VHGRLNLLVIADSSTADALMQGMLLHCKMLFWCSRLRCVDAQMSVGAVEPLATNGILIMLMPCAGA